MAEDSTANAITVLANDTDPDTGDTRTITAVTQPTNGTFSFNGADTTVLYTPDANFTGTDTFTYTITDGALATDTATVSVTVTNLNDPPNAGDFAGTVAEDSTNIAVDLSTLTDDVDGDALTYTITTPLAHGTLTPTGTPGHYTYTPQPPLTRPPPPPQPPTRPPVNDPPVAVDDTGITTPEDTAAVIPTATLTGNDTDIDGGPLTVTAVSDPIGGTVVLNGDNTITFTPTANTSGPASFTYTVSDGAGGTDSATVSIDRKSTRQNSSHVKRTRMTSSA